MPCNVAIGGKGNHEAKIVDGKFNKAKARNVAQGHKGSLTKGVDYTTVFAAAPDLGDIESLDPT